MNRTLALVIVAVMAAGIIVNYLLSGPNWVALIAVAIAGVAVAFGIGTPPPSDEGEETDLEAGDVETRS